MRVRKQIFRALKRKPMSFWELINYQDAHIAEFTKTVKELLEEGFIEYKDHKFYLSKEATLRAKEPVLCPVCGIGVKLQGFFLEVFKRFVEETKDRPLPKSDYDQGFVRPEDTVSRVAFMYERGDLEDQEIFILGDDDLLSVAIGLTGMAKRVTVVEIDERIVNFIRGFCERKGINWIVVREYNALKELPPEEKGKHDVFITDPVETFKGLKLFVGRCIEALKGKGSVGYIGLTHREASLKKWWEFERFLIEAGFVITDILRNFSVYPERENMWEEFYKTYEVMKWLPLKMPDTDWYKSSFIRFEAVTEPKLPEFDPPRSPKELYLDEEAWATPKTPHTTEENL